MPLGRWTAHEHLPSTPSTNAVALGRAAEGVASGLVVTTDHQTAGRGRLGRRWIDQPAGASLPVSFLVDAPRWPTLVPLAAGLAAAAAILASLGRRGAAPEPALKWPNDVLLADRKVCGILTEVAIDGRLVVGIGTNVDWRDTDHPDDRTSVAEAAGGDVDRDTILTTLAAELDRRLGQVDEAPDRLLADYRSACSTLGRPVEVTTPGGAVAGFAEDVDGSGALRLRTADGVLTVRAGDVHHVRPLPEGHGEPERGAASLLAVDADRPAHGLDEHP